MDSVVAGTVAGSTVITRTWSLEDEAGNAAATQVQTITVKDNSAPTFTAPADLTIYTDANCNYDASVTATGDVTDETDNCSISLEATFIDSVVAGTVAGSSVITRTWSLEDEAGNAAATQVQTITVKDNSAPTFTAPADLTIYTDANCNYDASVTATGDVTDETDNCSTSLEATFIDSVVAGTVAGSSVITRTWSLEDEAGNAAATQVQTIAVKDNSAPTITAPAPITVSSDSNCEAVNVILGDPVTDDNCPGFTVTNNAPAAFPLGVTTVTWTITDLAGNKASADQLVTVADPDNNCETGNCAANNFPVITALMAPTEPLPIDQEFTVSTTFIDNNGKTVYWFWGDGSETILDITSNQMSASHSYVTPGVYTITSAIVDDCGEFTFEDYEYVVAYDPSGGFVTGSGRIHSPKNAYSWNPDAEGEARFGFVSKYKKGAKIPEGRTRFEFINEEFTFISDEYEWLTVAGNRAMFKGVGTINGNAGYMFLISAIDDDLNGDKFRIKIWEITTEEVVYDNEVGVDESSDPTTWLYSGNIKVHTPKGKGESFNVADSDTPAEVNITTYPNPIESDGFYIVIPSEAGGETLEARIHDYSGRLLIQKLIEVPVNGGEIFWSLDHSEWDQGVYVLKLTNGNREYQTHLMKNE